MKHMFSFKTRMLFWDKVDKGLAGDDTCWPWLGCTTRGYGRFNAPYISDTRAHRIAWLMANGKEIPSGMFVCHTCDNPSCCNPDHLFLGTHQENMDDKVSKGRQLVGSNHYKAKLNEKQVTEIMKLLNAGRLKQYEIAEMFEVNEDTISSINLRKTWKHLPWPK